MYLGLLMIAVFGCGILYGGVIFGRRHRLRTMDVAIAAGCVVISVITVEGFSGYLSMRDTIASYLIPFLFWALFLSAILDYKWLPMIQGKDIRK